MIMPWRPACRLVRALPLPPHAAASALAVPSPPVRSGSLSLSRVPRAPLPLPVPLPVLVRLLVVVVVQSALVLPVLLRSSIASSRARPAPSAGASLLPCGAPPRTELACRPPFTRRAPQSPISLSDATHCKRSHCGRGRRAPFASSCCLCANVSVLTRAQEEIHALTLELSAWLSSTMNVCTEF